MYLVLYANQIISALRKCQHAGGANHNSCKQMWLLATQPSATRDDNFWQYLNILELFVFADICGKIHNVFVTQTNSFDANTVAHLCTYQVCQNTAVRKISDASSPAGCCVCNSLLWSVRCRNWYWSSNRSSNGICSCSCSFSLLGDQCDVGADH